MLWHHTTERKPVDNNKSKPAFVNRSGFLWLPMTIEEKALIRVNVTAEYSLKALQHENPLSPFELRVWYGKERAQNKKILRCIVHANWSAINQEWLWSAP